MMNQKTFIFETYMPGVGLKFRILDNFVKCSYAALKIMPWWPSLLSGQIAFSNSESDVV